jgi:hypothetical protein
MLCYKYQVIFLHIWTQIVHYSKKNKYAHICVEKLIYTYNFYVKKNRYAHICEEKPICTYMWRKTDMNIYLKKNKYAHICEEK